MKKNMKKLSYSFIFLHYIVIFPSSLLRIPEFDVIKGEGGYSRILKLPRRGMRHETCQYLSASIYIAPLLGFQSPLLLHLETIIEFIITGEVSLFAKEDFHRTNVILQYLHRGSNLRLDRRNV